MDIAATVQPREEPTAKNDDGRQAVDAAEDNKFYKAVSAWRNIDLTRLIPTLDNTASDLVAHQRDTLVERKDLAQKTKDFRKLDDTGKLGEIKGVLKAYQTYIDLVTNQSKTVSSSFLQLYSSLSEAPDPYPLLEASIDSLIIVEETVPRIQEENKRLNATVAKLTAQLDETEARLQEERHTRQTFEENRESSAKDVEASWAAVLAEKEDNWQAKEQNLEDKVESQERLLKELKASLEVSQRLERGEQGDFESSRGGSSAVELEILNSDLERAHSRLAEVEARNEQLRLQLAQSATQKEAASTATEAQDDPSFLRLRSENSSLLRKADAARFERDKQIQERESSIRELKKETASLREGCDALRSKVDKWSDYEDVKRELDILKSIEFSTGYDDDVAEADEQGAQNGTVDKSPSQNLEQLLLSRNKKLNNELTVLRVSHQDLAARLEALQEELSNTNMALEKSRSLSTTLENDLLRMQETGPSGATSVTGTLPVRHGSSNWAGRRGRTSPTSSIISGIESPGGHSTTLDALRAGEPVGGGSGILPMVTAQRDRFKKRNNELEAELSKSYQTVSSLRSEVASLQKDNLNLYEKTRYVSSYNRGQSTTSSAYPSSPNPSTVYMSGSNGAPLDRYESAYESKISPFAAFRGRESARAFKRMSLPERFVFQITRLVLATRTSRNLFALYCLALHLLVFLTLYWMSTVDIEKHSSHFAGSTAHVVGSAGAALANGEIPDLDDWHQAGFQQDAG